jgi:O-antigen/teichoic acid export membrane protein
VNDSRPGGDTTDLESRSAAIAAGHSLRKNALFAILGNGLLNLCRLLVVVLLAKFTTAEIQGTYTYVSIALAAPVVLFCGLELRVAFIADARDEFPFGVYRALRTLGMAVAGVMLLIIVLWSARSEANGALIWMMLATCAGRIVLHLAEIYWGVYQRRERLDLTAWSNTLRGLGMLAPFAILLPLFGNGDAATAPMLERLLRVAASAVSVYVVAWTAVWWFFDRRRVVGHRDVNLWWSWPAVAKVAQQTLPLGLVFLLIGLCETVTQWFIKRAAGSAGWAEVGYFGAMRVVTLGAMFLIIQISTAAGNRLAVYYQKDLGAFLRLAGKLTGVAVCIGATALLGALLFGEWFLRMLYTPEHAAHYPEFLILVLAQAIVLLAAVFGSVTTHMRQFWIQVPVQVSVLAVTVAAASLLVGPDNPVRGGAWTMLARSGTQAVLYLGCVLIGLRWRNRVTSAEGG